MQKGFSFVGILIVVGIIVVAGAAWYTLDTGIWKLDTGGSDEEFTACSQEALQCPDGSYVSRTGPNCVFAECPTLEVGQDVGEIDMSNWKTYRNEEYGFEMKYNDVWGVKECYSFEIYFGTQDELEFPCDYEGAISAYPSAKPSIYVSVGTDTTLENIDHEIKAIKAGLEDGVSQSSIYIDGSEAIVIRGKEVVNRRQHVHVLLSHGKYRYVLEYFEYGDADQEYLTVFDRMLTTFKFLP